MTRTTFYTATTLDGYIADANDSLDWLFIQPQDEGGPLNYEAFIADIGAICMGSTTYEWVVNHQTQIGEPWMYEMPSFVFTHRTSAGDGRRRRHVRGRRRRAGPRRHDRGRRRQGPVGGRWW